MLILLSQGQSTLAGCHHPSVDPIDVRVSSDIYSATSAIVDTLEVSLACSTPTEATEQLSPRPHTRFHSIRGKPSWTPSSSHASQPQLQIRPTQKEYDAMDEG